MSKLWLDYVEQREDAEIAALVDLYPETARKLAEARGLKVPIFSSLADALRETDTNLVFDITIPASHKEIVTTALQAGRPVFGEKPMAESMEDAREVVRISEASRQRYSVMQNRRYNRKIRSLQHAIQQGRIGRVGSLHADFFIGAHFGGFREAMASPLLVDMAIHTFDAARLISGANAVSVYCHEFNPPGSWYQGKAAAICIFEMSDGSVFTYQGSWAAEGFRTSWEADWRIVGEKGTLLWDGDQMPHCEALAPASKEAFLRDYEISELADEYTGQEGHWGCLDEMFAALEQGRPAETDSTDNLHSMAMVFGALESARTGQKIKLM